jgi:hypothetical protein
MEDGSSAGYIWWNIILYPLNQKSNEISKCLPHYYFLFKSFTRLFR